MVEPNVDPGATTAGDTDANALRPAALEADLEPRVARVEELVAGFAQVLERFQGARDAFGATVFDNFDDPGVSNDALDLLYASSTDARRDLAVLRRDAPMLDAPSAGDADHLLVTRLRVIGQSAGDLAARFEQYGRSISLAVPPRTPGGVGRLNEFVGLIVRALLDIAEALDGLRSNPAATPSGRAATPPSEQRRSPGIAIGTPVAGALWRILRRRRTRLMLESAAVVVVGLAILFSALRQGPAPDLLAGAGSPSAGPGRTGAPDVALGSGSPTAPTSSPASTEAGASAAPTPSSSSTAPASTPPRSTPRPTQRPAPTPHPPAAVTQFGNRTAAAAAAVDGLLNTITTAVQDADLLRAASAANEIGATATGERSWLQSHPATACYQSVQESAMSAYGELIVTANAIAETAEAGDANAIHPQVASSHGDVSTLRQAGNKAVAACA